MSKFPLMLHFAVAFLPDNWLPALLLTVYNELAISGCRNFQIICSEMKIINTGPKAESHSKQEFSILKQVQNKLKEKKHDKNCCLFQSF